MMYTDDKYVNDIIYRYTVYIHTYLLNLIFITFLKLLKNQMVFQGGNSLIHILCADTGYRSDDSQSYVLVYTCMYTIIYTW